MEAPPRCTQLRDPGETLRLRRSTCRSSAVASSAAASYRDVSSANLHAPPVARARSGVLVILFVPGHRSANTTAAGLSVDDLLNDFSWIFRLLILRFFIGTTPPVKRSHAKRLDCPSGKSGLIHAPLTPQKTHGAGFLSVSRKAYRAVT